MKIDRCKLGLHKWGKAKQWVDSNGKPVFTKKCVICQKLKDK
jgi:hypothetical protein